MGLERYLKTRAELRSNHGTPEEFEQAVWKAFADLFVTMDEAVEAISKYREEYAGASEVEELSKLGEQES
jgi:hypothetical protein